MTNFDTDEKKGFDTLKEQSSAKKSYGGIPVNRFAFTLLVVITVLHIIIIMLIIDVNRSSTQLSDLMQRSGNYQIEATSIMEGNTALSETCANYIQMPVVGDGSANVGPLNAYAEQLKEKNNASKVLERFRTYNVSDEVLSCIEEATRCSQQMFEMQNHAISLMKSVYPIPPIPDLAVIPEVPLTEEELSMPPEARAAAAKQIIIDKEYASLRYHASKSIEQCNLTLRQEFDKASEAAAKHVATVRLLLWISVFIIIMFLSVTFVMFYELIVKPVRKYSDEIDENKSIEQVKAIAELRRLVSAHNRQWERRNKLESILREAAETDTLTGLPNRYCMERDLIENENYVGSMGVLLFDINFLKKTNDTEGHIAGDKLICKTADCIKQCFSTKDTNSCYRIGGDEFVAVLTGCSEDEINIRIEHFQMMLERENITVSVGYAYEKTADSKSFRTLMEKADKLMYEHKQLIHEEYAAIVNAGM